MPSGRIHDRITLWSLPWVVGVTLVLTRQGNIALIIAGAFLFSGLMFGPDLDIYSVQFKRWGKLRFIWHPYQKLLRHRSWLSHGLIVGTALRLVYLFGWLSLVGSLGLVLVQFVWGVNWWQPFTQAIVHYLRLYSTEAIALVLGLELGAMSHALSDWLTSAYKRRQKSKSRKK